MAEAVTVANRFLAIAKKRGDTLTPMQILKLVYIAHGWMLGLYGRPLITDEIQAWQYGPVIPRLYNKMKDFRSLPVQGPLPTGQDEALSDEEEDIIVQVYDIYGAMSGPALSRLTHAKGTPWAMTYEDGVFGIVIPNDIIEDHYAMLAKEQATS